MQEKNHAIYFNLEPYKLDFYFHFQHLTENGRCGRGASVEQVSVQSRIQENGSDHAMTSANSVTSPASSSDDPQNVKTSHNKVESIEPQSSIELYPAV